MKKHGLKRIVRHIRPPIDYKADNLPKDIFNIQYPGGISTEFLTTHDVQDLDGKNLKVRGVTEVRLFDDIDWLNLKAERSLLCEHDLAEKPPLEDSLTPKVVARAYCSHKESEYNKRKGRIVATAKAIRKLGLKW